jgi:WD40 repeat protein
LGNKNRKIIKTFKGHAGKVHCVLYSPDGKHIFSSSADGTIKKWKVKTGEHLTLIQYTNGEWLVKDSKGNFDCSVGGAKYIYFVRGMHFLPRNKYFKRYYKPKLLSNFLRA